MSRYYTIFFKMGQIGFFCRKKEMKQTPKHKMYGTAESLFTEQGMSCTTISETLGLTEATLSKWRNQMDWDSKRETILTSPGKIRDILRDELKWIAGGSKSRVDSDALVKIAKTLQYFEGKVALTVIISVFKEFDNWMAEVDPVMAVKFTEFHRQFANHRAQIDSLK